MSLLEPIVPTLLSVRRIPNADPALLAAYGADPTRHTSLGLVTCDQDDALYVALDEATKHAAVDVVFAGASTPAAPTPRASCRARSSACSPPPSRSRSRTAWPR
jgi:ethanolamine utilization microcompartment shell protein EutL